jgi:hypothetical protein
MACILLCIYLYNIQLLISQSTQQFLQWQNKHYCVNTSTTTENLVQILNPQEIHNQIKISREKKIKERYT